MESSINEGICDTLTTSTVPKIQKAWMHVRSCHVVWAMSSHDQMIPCMASYRHAIDKINNSYYYIQSSLHDLSSCM